MDSDSTTIGPVSTGPIPIVSLDELLQTTEALTSVEESDRNKLRSLLDIDQVVLRSRLLAWASGGFPDQYVIYTIQLSQSTSCSDGVTRDIVAYMTFLLPDFSLVGAVSTLESKLPGMGLSYSYTASKCLSIHVSKKQL